MPTRFGLIRHGETEWNREKRIQGQQDSPLTPTGEQQAVTWGKQLATLAWDRLVASDLGRARATAKLINQALNLPLDTTADLREQDWGAWIGLTVPEIKQQHKKELKRQIQSGWQFCPPGGETRANVFQRSRRALEATARRWPDQTILVVAHEGVIKCLLYRLSNRQFLPEEPPLIKPRHLHWLSCTSGQLAIDAVNAIPL
jgi:probable phosphoglycerate mutase